MEARVVSVFGPFNNRALVEMSAEDAMALVAQDEVEVPRARSIVAAEAEVERIRKVDADLADSLLAALVVSLAYEIENPYNSATSKSMCAHELRQTIDRLRELMPAEKRKGALHDIKSGHASRLRLAQGGSSTKD